MQTLWLFIGGSLFGYSIGNISSYLSYSRKEDLEYGEYISFFNDLFNKHDIDPKMQQIALNDINDYYNNLENREF